VRGRDLTVQRQTMSDGVSDVTLTTPWGKTRTLSSRKRSRASGAPNAEANELGLWRSERLHAHPLANVGPANRASSPR